jgi:hypothetical protein
MGFHEAILHRFARSDVVPFDDLGRMAFEMSSVPSLKSCGKAPLIAIMRSSSRTTIPCSGIRYSDC